MKFFRKFGLHILLWGAMFFYFVFAPDVLALIFTQNGKPMRVGEAVPAESDRIQFDIENLVPYVKDGEELYELYGWAFMIPDEAMPSTAFVPEIMLVSNEQSYNFSVRPVQRRPKLPDEFLETDIDFETLGFSALILEDAIKPGKYRIGIVFRNTSKDLALYRDKPVYYLVKTPNTLSFEKK